MGKIYMKYRELIKREMEKYDDKTIFIGYNTKYAHKGYGTLSDIPKSRIIETPCAENLMMGLAIGMAMEGFKPVVFFERHDFMLNALDQIVNHLDKHFNYPVAIRGIIGSRLPINPGIQHTQNFTKAFKEMIKFPIFIIKRKEDIEMAYRKAKKLKTPYMIIEHRSMYDA